MSPTGLRNGAEPGIPGLLRRRVTVTPGMCSGGSLVYARFGDWTWEAVASAADMNVYRARNAEGLSAYLSFHYFRVSCDGGLHPQGLTFGDELDVTSRVFGLGSQSVVTVHRLSRAGELAHDTGLEPEEAFRRGRPGCLYVENCNRWISRRKATTNSGLVDASPVGFRHHRLDALPGTYSPRLVMGRAKKDEGFFPAEAEYAPVGPAVTSTHALDPARDFNGVGLVYFASYFSFADAALLRAWRALGRSDRQFLERTVLDHHLGFFGNADLGSVIRVDVALRRSRRDPALEIADVVMRERGSERLLAVAGIRTRTVPADPPRPEGE